MSNHDDQLEESIHTVGAYADSALAAESQLLAERELRSIQAAKRQQPRPPNMATATTGFRNRGEYFQALTRSCGPEAKASGDVRLAPFWNSAGFSAPSQWNDEIVAAVLRPPSLAGRCRLYRSTQTTFALPVDGTVPWNHPWPATWLDTAGTIRIAQGKLELQLHQFSLSRVAALVPATDELLDDSPLLEDYLDQAGPARLQWELDYQLIHGLGVHRPLGVLNSSATITVTAESGGSGTAPQYQDLLNMLSRFHGDRSRAVWLVHPDLEPGLLAVRDPDGNPVYRFGAGESFGRLFGIEVAPHEVCSAAGERGDLILADLSQYNLAAKTRRRQFSIHLWFEQDITAFRFVLPVDGQPSLASPIVSRAGGGVRSPFVCLGARS